MINIIFAVLSSYIVTIVLAKSSIFEGFRTYIKDKFPKLKIGNYPHFIECRLCLGLWASFLFCLMYNNPHDILVVWGASYFLATQERT